MCIVHCQHFQQIWCCCWWFTFQSSVESTQQSQLTAQICNFLINILQQNSVVFSPKAQQTFPGSLFLYLTLSLSLWFAHKALAFLTALLLHYNTLSYSGIWHIQLHTATFSISGIWLKRSPNRGHHVACLLVCLFVHKYHFLKMEIGKDNHYLGPTWIGKTRSKAMDFLFKSCSMHRKQTFW